MILVKLPDHRNDRNRPLSSPQDEQAFFFRLHCHELGILLVVHSDLVRANKARARDLMNTSSLFFQPLIKGAPSPWSHRYSDEVEAGRRPLRRNSGHLERLEF